jgi:hypothetical protein
LAALKKITVTLLIGILLAILPGMSALAQPLLPARTKNINPFINGYGAVIPDSPYLLSQDEWMASADLELANNSIAADSTNEAIVIDGEGYLLDLNFHYGYSKDVELLFSIPLIYYSGGFLDQVIKSWHDLWGMSNDRRDEFPNNQLHFEYTKDGNTLINIDSATGGIGDVVLGLKYSSNKLIAGATTIALRLDLKLPTGDPDKLTGSGATDVTLSVLAANPSLLAKYKTILYGGAGLVALGKGDILPDIQRDLVGNAYVGATWAYSPRFALLAQLNFQSSYYESELNQLGANSFQLYLNGIYTSQDNVSYEFGFGENLATDTTPDFLLYFSVSKRYWSRI